ncbi:hypothetical protein JHL16_31390 [Aestuariivirga sp. YIM B02566]|jgi:type IV pilus biogenesis protein CpaD/CtpE|uniref:Uncharacterized protein n=1 Tax=Taklimakanibacter albus TaxID=2800327 RepID=A0ACC5RE65_9HYPH|nr:hypothetical protein [Aestuariivirga sp. YIM B02566]
MNMNMLISVDGFVKALALSGVALLAVGCKKDGPTLDDLYAPQEAYYQRHPIVVTKSGAHARECGNWPKDLTRDAQNNEYQNFGCAQQNNIAAMVANPEDLIRPRIPTPSDPMRRSKVIDNYRTGEATSAATEQQQEKSKIADVAK